MQESVDLVVYCSDLIFTSNIKNAAKSRNMAVSVKRVFDPMLDFEEQGVKMYIVDLELKGEDPCVIIETIKSLRPETKIVCFAPHVEVELLDKAQEVGADHVLSRGEFVKELPLLLG